MKHVGPARNSFSGRRHVGPAGSHCQCPFGQIAADLFRLAFRVRRALRGDRVAEPFGFVARGGNGGGVVGENDVRRTIERSIIRRWQE